MKRENMRNFSIIAHIDHGKSTLADRLIEYTKSVSQRKMKKQLLDSMDLEQERGITIKLNAVQLKYNFNQEDYYFHLIDTPGHVDFTYEVSRSLAACEGAILVVDAAQGIEAQTLANVYLALENNLTIIPVINKIDLPNSNIEKVKKELKETFDFQEEEILLVSAKTGLGIEDLIKRIIEIIPAPQGNKNNPLQALIFDSIFDSYRGVIILIRIINGKINLGDKIKLLNSNVIYEVVELGINNPSEVKKEELRAGEVGFICANIKNINKVQVGDTIVHSYDLNPKPLPGYKPLNPMVFCGLYPVDSSKYVSLKEALEKLKLNDASLDFEAESSNALGFGFRCGFLGLLHMEISLERIEREFNIDLIATSPSVIYQINLTDGKKIKIDNPTKLPPQQKITSIEEPYIKTTILVPTEYIGPIMELCQSKRGSFLKMDYIDKTRVKIYYKIPLGEIVYDFFDRLKSSTKGYASFDYEVIGYDPSKLVKMDILINGEVVDALSMIIHQDFVQLKGRLIVDNLEKLIPRQQFEVPIQAVLGSKVIARATIKAMRKNVLAKCYGGDVSRKRKLLEKQKEGKKKMKMVGKVEIPQEAFLSVLKLDN
ncbi:MAG: translation elongation factor 4 [Bacilli bacterium]|jgi:GTP-binding protein LepA